MRKQNYGILLPQVDDLQEIKVMLADRLEQWALAYIAEGELKGRQEGKQEGASFIYRFTLYAIPGFIKS